MSWLTALAVLALFLADLAGARQAAGAATSAATSAVTSAVTSQGTIYVIQGIHGVTADVRVDGRTVLAGAAAKKIVGPLRLEPGRHAVELVRAGTSQVLASGAVALRPGRTLDVVAHARADAASGYEVTAFADDLSPVAPGKLRLAVAHTAAAPPADITVDGKTLLSNVANAEALSVIVPGGRYRVAVVPSATAGDPILGPVDLTVAAGTLTRVFAIGDVRTGTMDAVVHALPVATRGAARPGSVQTGDGGQAATMFVSPDRRGLPYLWAAAGAGALALIAGIARARRRARPSAGPSPRPPVAPEPLKLLP